MVKVYCAYLELLLDIGFRSTPVLPEMLLTFWPPLRLTVTVTVCPS